MPFFAVIIPSYNRYEKLLIAVDSVLSQTFRDYEILIIDDGSTDKTSRIADMYAGKISYFHQENRGVSAARNKGVRASVSPYLAFLDSDDYWMPEKLEAHYSYIMENPDIRIHQTDEEWIRNGVRVNPMHKHVKRAGDIFLPSLKLCLISPSAVVINRDLLDESGLFDEKMLVCEDYDLWLRITCREQVGLINDKLIRKYGGHMDQLSRTYAAMDRFRLYSIIKLLVVEGSNLDPEKLSCAIKVALEKCAVLQKGAFKRNRMELSAYLEKIKIALSSECYSNIDYESLLQIEEDR